MAAYPLLAACIIAAGLALRWQCLQTGFTVDDYLQLSIVEGVYPVPRSAFELFTFANGDRAQNDVLRQAGLLTWWSQPALRIAMFRPLACALLWLDHALFGLDAFRYQLHCAAWWLAMAAALAALLRRVLPASVALLALALFVVDEGHNALLNWIAVRNATVATTFGLLGLLAQIRQREDGLRFGRPLALGCYALALAAGEYALPLLAYALLYELQQPWPWAQRLRALIAPAAMLALYFGIRFAAGAGASGSGMYIHPLDDPSEFVRLGFVRYTLLVADLVFALPALYWTWGMDWPRALLAAGAIPRQWLMDMTTPRLVHFAIAVACTAAAIFILRAALRAADASGLQRARFLVLGAPLALVPVVSSFAESRLVIPALVGFCVVPPLLLHARLRELRAGAGRWLATAAAALLVLLHLVVPSARAGTDAELAVAIASGARRSILAPALDPLLRPGKRVLLLTAADTTSSIYGALVRKLHRRPAPDEWHMLSSTLLPQKLERLSASSFALERVYTGYTGGDTYAEFFSNEKLLPGRQFAAGAIGITVEATYNGRPMRTRYDLPAPLEDPSFVFLRQTRNGLVQVAMPPIGASVLLEPAAPPVDAP